MWLTVFQSLVRRIIRQLFQKRQKPFCLAVLLVLLDPYLGVQAQFKAPAFEPHHVSVVQHAVGRPRPCFSTCIILWPTFESRFSILNSSSAPIMGPFTAL